MPFAVSITGAHTGPFKGESQNAKQKGKIDGLGFSYEVTTPRDAATGQATGKRKHGPVTIIKAVGAASPQIFNAMVTNETLTTVLCEFLQTSPQGLESVVYTVKLTDAAVSGINQTLDAFSPAGQPLHGVEYEAVSFVFRKIEVASVPGGTSASDAL